MPSKRAQDSSAWFEDQVPPAISERMILENYTGLRPMYAEYNMGNYYREFSLKRTLTIRKIRAMRRKEVLAGIDEARESEAPAD